ncbi:zinc-dependent alcohol dehydrogenase family protein [Nocardiopsis nanhaiensis]
MRAVVMHGPRDVRVEEIKDAAVIEPTDAVIRVTATCVCGSDLWPYRGVQPQDGPTPMGHEYIGVVEQTGPEVRDVQEGDFVVGSFVASDNTCENCRAGYQSFCVRHVFLAAVGTQSEYARIPLADGTLVKVPGEPTPRQARGLLAASDVLGTGWFGAAEAGAGPGKTVAVVGDGAVGLCAVLAAKRLGAERIIAVSRHADRQRLAERFGATHIVEERGDAGAAEVKELTGGYGAHATVEAVGTGESMKQAIRSTRPGESVAYVRLPHGVELDGTELFFSGVRLHGGPAPARSDRPDHDRPDRPGSRLRRHSPVGGGR